MFRNAIFVAVALLFGTSTLTAQSTFAFNQFASSQIEKLVEQGAKGGGKAAQLPVAAKPLSRFAIGGGVSLMGINLQAATNLNQHMNLRATGNLFSYTVNNITTNGFELNGQVNMAAAGVSADYYPWAKHGFRLSPGVMLYNKNHAGVTIVAAPGTSFKLNDEEYYSSSSNPVQGSASVGLHAQNPAFTITTGWGNMIPHKRGHWSFPFELGAAITGTPVINMALTAGQVCDSAGQNCVDVANDATVNSNLQAQIAKYRNDLNPVKVYPILSFGVAYSFHLR
jgi:hypothetical protein